MMKNCFVFLLLSAVLLSVFADEERIVKCDNCPNKIWLIVKPSLAEPEPIVEMLPSANRAKITTAYAIVKRLSSVEKKYGDAPIVEAALNGQSEILKREVIFHKIIFWPKKTIVDYFLKAENNSVVEKAAEKESFSFEIFFFLLGVLFIGILTGATPYYNKNLGESTIITALLLSALCFGSIVFFYQAKEIVTYGITRKILGFIFAWALSSLISGLIIIIFACLAISIKEKLKKINNYLTYLSGLIFIVAVLSVAVLIIGFSAGNWLYWISNISLIGGSSTAVSMITCILIDLSQKRHEVV